MRLNKQSFLIILFAVLAVAYVILLIVLPVDARSFNKYHLTSEHSRDLSLAIAIPYVVIWFTGLFSYLQLDSYAKKIRGSQDGQAFLHLATGLLALALALPLSAIISNVNLLIVHGHRNFLPSSIIVNNYVSLVPVLVAFYFIFRGAKQLYQLLPSFKVQAPDAEFVPALFILASTWFAYFTITNPARHHPTSIAKVATFYLPDWLIVTTIILPYIIMLYFGFSSVVYLRMYLKHVPGILYKRALKLISHGTLIAISALITLRIISSMTAWFESRTLKFLLVIVYMLLFVIGTGYGLIHHGAKKLNQIEDVSSDSRVALLKRLMSKK